MAAIDTLRLARALQNKGGLNQESAEATAEAVNDAISEGTATKLDIIHLESKITLVDSKATLLLWAVGLNFAATVTILTILARH